MWMNEWMIEWMHACMHACMNGRLVEQWTLLLLCVCVYNCICVCAYTIHLFHFSSIFAIHMTMANRFLFTHCNFSNEISELFSRMDRQNRQAKSDSNDCVAQSSTWLHWTQLKICVYRKIRSVCGVRVYVDTMSSICSCV